MKNRKNQMIEAMRYVACSVVLFIHCNLAEPMGNILNKYGRFAVPFFLLVSGYYAYDFNLSEKSEKKIRQTLYIILLHGSICIIWNCVNSYFKYDSLIYWTRPYLSMNTLKELLLFNRAVFINSSFYYFFMLLYLYLFCIIVYNFGIRQMSYLYTFAGIMYVVGYCVHHFCNKPWYYVGNYLFTGIPLFFIGHLLHSNYRVIATFRKKPLLILLTGILLTYAETHLFHGAYLTVGQALVAIALLFLCINNAHKNMGILAILGSECSMYIMIYHCQLRDSTALFIDRTSWYFPLIVLLFATCLGIIISTLRGKTLSRQR